MGGVLSAPKSETPVIQPVVDNAAQRAEEERKKAMERQRRGLESTIKTSYHGVLDTKNMNRKKLLGE